MTQSVEVKYLLLLLLLLFSPQTISFVQADEYLLTHLQFLPGLGQM